MVAWWPGDGDGNDLAGTNNGALLGGATAGVAGKAGLAIRFDGTNGHVQIPDSAVLRPSNLTIEAWVRFDSLDSPASGNSPAGEQFIVFKEGIHLEYWSGYALTKVRNGGGDVFSFEVDSTSGQVSEVRSQTLVQTGAWYHVAGVRGSNYLQLYVNGQLESQTNVSFPQSYGDYPLYFGTSGQPAWDHRFAGVLDEISLYDHALSSNQIAAIYNAAADGKCKPVAFVAHPANRLAAIGSNVTFTVTATGSLPLGYQWQRDGADLTNGGSVFGALSPTLSLASVALDDSAGYRVIVTNVAGPATSAVAVLQVVPELNPPVITDQPDSYSVTAGTNLTFHVSASGTLPLSYQWRLNGTNLTDNAYFSGANSSGLTLNYVLWAPCQAGMPRDYTVVVTNLAGSVTSATATLNITPPPAVSFPDANLEAAVRSALSVPTGWLAPAGLLLLTNLHVCGEHITNLWGLEYAANLGSLSLPRNGITDLEPLRCLSGLAQLDLSYNHISDLSPLASLAGLTNLNAGDNLIADAKGIASLTGLTGLWLEGNSISDLTFLRNLTQLGSLAVDRNNVTNIAVITNLTKLKSLALGGNPALTTHTPLSKLTNVVSLSLRESLISDLSVLQGLKLLTLLDLYEAGLVRNLSPLTALTNLSRLDLSWDSSVTNCAVLAGSTSLSNLYLRGVPIKNPAFLTNLYRLTLLNLDSTELSDASPVGALTNLTYLGMTANPKITNFSALSNLTSLVNLELRANSISNLAFMSGLRQLGYADLAYNDVSDLLPLAGLTNLHALVLDGNPASNYGAIAASNSLTHLWLSDNAISDVSFVSNMSRLSYLNLDRNHITNIAPLAALTNLTGLGLGGNSVTDYPGLESLTNLTSLRLEQSVLSETNLGFLTNLTQLASLSLNQNRISDVGALAGLPKLKDLYLRRNRISDITPLETLPRLLNVGVGLNLLELDGASAARQTIQNMERKGIEVKYEPQNQAPRFASLTLNQRPLFHAPTPRGFITANTNSVLTAGVWEAPLPGDGELVVTALSSSPDHVAVPSAPLPGTDYSRTVTLAAGDLTNQAVAITLTVTDDVLMSGTTNIELVLLPNTNVWDACASADPNLVIAISSWLGKATEEVTPADLLMLDTLSVEGANVSDSCIWQWLTNLTFLLLDGNSVSDLNTLTNLTHLTSLALADVSVTNFAPLAGLAGLTNLYINGESITSLSTLPNLPQLTSLALRNLGATNLSPLQGVTNLGSLSLLGPFVSDLTSLTNLSQLRSLSLYKTRVQELTPLGGLTNLGYLHLQHNRLAEVSTLTNLPQLVYVDLTLNLLDLSPNSSAMTTIQTLIDRGVMVDYLPQRQAPAVTMTTNWVLAAGAPSWLYFSVLDDVWPSDLSVAVHASNTNLLPSADLLVSQDLTAFWIDWFVKLTSTTNHTNSITVTAVNDAGVGTNVTAVVMVVPPLALPGSVFPEANLESWVTNANARWFGQTVVSHGGAPAAQSGSTTNGGRSRLEAVAPGPGVLTFWWKASSETNYDWLRFYINTNERARISGEAEWQQAVYQLPPGQHTLWWDYSKDAYKSQGMDAGWVAEVKFESLSWLEGAAPPGDGQFHLSLYGAPGGVYEIQASSNLVIWSTVTTITNTATNSSNGAIYADLMPTNWPRRFYRAKPVP